MKNFSITRAKKISVFLAFLLLTTAIGYFSYSTSFTRQEVTDYDLSVPFPNLSFTRPVGIFNTGDTRLFVVEQAGQVHIIDPSVSNDSTTVFLDIKDQVLYGGEQGLLGLAFHPEFSLNGLFYVNYVRDSPRRTVISEFKVREDNQNLTNISSEIIILEVSQPHSNHNGGEITFGPDGNLYIALGDGGGSGDPNQNGQDRTSLLGSILRINIDIKSLEKNYSIPPDNPFVGNAEGFREEIYAYGLRNPWRMSFDYNTSLLWAGDVGQNLYEEIDIIEKGGNYGWNLQEGNHCYNNPNCNTTELITPIWEYNRLEGYSITGGYVYYGLRNPTLNAKYIYGDYGSGKIWALSKNGTTTENMLVKDTNLNIASFGLDNQGEIYICAFDGRIYSILEKIDNNQTSSKIEISTTSEVTTSKSDESSSNGKSTSSITSYGIEIVALFVLSTIIVTFRKKI